MALAFQLRGAGCTPTELSTEAAVTLIPEGQSFRISRSALTLAAAVPDLDEATFAKVAGDAEKNCPVSKVLNAKIALDAKLVRLPPRYPRHGYPGQILSNFRHWLAPPIPTNIEPDRAG